MTYQARHKRKEFSKDDKRTMLQRSGGKCEAVGVLYGLPDGERCNVSLAYGVHFEHVTAASIGGLATIDNGLATCPSCNLWKADHVDKPRAAKTKRQSDKFHGITKPKGKIRSRVFGSWKPNVKDINEDMDEPRS